MSSPSANAERVSAARERRQTRRAILAASIGNAFEWYDFTVYALFAIYIASAFFPEADSTSGVIRSFLAFGIGFVIRPIGAVVLGAYADRHGRKAALTLAIALMAVGTLVIAVTPSYAVIGLGAPLLLLAGRSLQGFSAGGEVGGALTFLVEHAPDGRRGAHASWLQASMAASNILGALVAFSVTTLLSPEQMAAWGWRVPFAFGLLIAPIGIWLRRTLDETPAYVKLDAARRDRDTGHRAAPLSAFVQLTRSRPQLLLCGVGLSILWTVGSYALVIFFPTYVQRTFGFSAQHAFTASLIGNVLMTAACLAGGLLSDRYGRRRVLLVDAAVLAICTHPLLWLVAQAPTIGTLVVVQSLLCISVGLFVGAAPAALAGLFPVDVRATAVSISYNVAVTVFGGFAPAFLSWLIAAGQPFAPAWYVTIAAILALPALISLQHSEGDGRALGAASPVVLR
jgi:MHS family proline/betaine transporter-like MFS transporter